MAEMVYITAPDMQEARKIAVHLLEKRLIACANLFPIESLYRWEGEMQDDEEVAMITKTTHQLVDRVIREVKSIHSYDVPCIVCYRVDRGEKDYLNWVRDQTDVVSDLNV